MASDTKILETIRGRKRARNVEQRNRAARRAAAKKTNTINALKKLGVL